MTCFLLGVSSLFLHLDLVSTSCRAGFQVYLFQPWVLRTRPRQYDTICSKLDLIFRFFVFSWLIVWANGVSKCGWRLAGGRGCWLKDLHHVSIVSWFFHHFLHFLFIRLSHFYQEKRVCCLQMMGDGVGGGWLIYIRMWAGVRGWVPFYSFCFILVLLYFVVSRSQSLYVGG